MSISRLRGWIFTFIAGEAFERGVAIMYRICGYVVASLRGIIDNSTLDGEQKIKIQSLIAGIQSVMRFIERVSAKLNINLGGLSLATQEWDGKDLSKYLDKITEEL